FQGQWLESNTDFYHFRARYYDPETGRFVSRDPIDVIEYEPESSNPYQFVYNNPHVYSDPTGMFTLVELQSGFATEKALSKAQLAATNAMRDYLIDKAKGVVTEIVMGLAKRITDNLAVLSPTLAKALEVALSTKEKNKLGSEWERILKGEFQELIKTSFPGSSYLESIWFEAEIQPDGTPNSNGINLAGLSADVPKNLSNPDFIIKPDGGPKATDYAKGKAHIPHFKM
ncbi:MULTISPECIES: RHS repeat-associated core domain-containing protein, partial [Spirulina sp. CCY15215]|uniref:RHS repeat domain-containing protein n=1 Tax=Spirulina sp. CCY15215 TaxID=2767591 RepID=UPI001951B57B